MKEACLGCGETEGCVTGVEEGEEEVEEEDEGERLAQREGRRRLAGQAGLEKFFWTEEEEEETTEEDALLSFTVRLVCACATEVWRRCVCEPEEECVCDDDACVEDVCVEVCVCLAPGKRDSGGSMSSMSNSPTNSSSCSWLKLGFGWPLCCLGLGLWLRFLAWFSWFSWFSWFCRAQAALSS